MIKIKNDYGFTLVELIVVIIILATLGTLAFISLQNYASDARDSTRLSDVSNIKISLELHKTKEGRYPEPDSKTDISYSGSILWKQGSFGSGALYAVERLSENPVDPLTKQNFDYSITANGGKFQMGLYLENLQATYNYIDSAYAISNDGLEAYVTGTYSAYDLKSQSGSDCILVTAPSILMTNPPIDGSLGNLGNYNFSFSSSKNIPPYLAQYIDLNIAGVSFQIEEVYNKCSVDSLDDLQLYIAQLSTNYQQFSDISLYDEVVYAATTDFFKKAAVIKLLENGISISESLIKSLNSPIPNNVFTDIFTGQDNDLLVGDHIAVTGTGTWALISGSPAAYEIDANTLLKVDNSISLVQPVPSPPITLSGSLVAFDIESFGGGEIKTYMRYTNANNYYAVSLDSSGYKITRMLGGVEDTFTNIVDPISVGSTIRFSVYGDTLILSINDIEKETILASGIESVGSPAIYLSNVGASIDNFSFTYK